MVYLAGREVKYSRRNYPSGPSVADGPFFDWARSDLTGKFDWARSDLTGKFDWGGKKPVLGAL